jgi:tRNA (cytidine56-2'-O)-methyltransferase
MITVLRIGHRPDRDKRITTHVALVARAFGADEILIDKKDTELERTFQGVCERFGGKVNIKTGVKWREAIKNWKGQIVHLTMYGEEFDTAMEELDRNKNLMIVLGSEKVPREVYEMADINISVGNQPHSEVAALAVFLYKYFDGRPLKIFEDGQVKIIPNRKGKTVVEK